MREHCRRWQAANREYSRQRYLANKKEHNARAVAWRVANPEGAYASAKKWRAANRDAVSVINQRRRSRKKSCLGDHTVAEWQAVVAKHRGMCASCGAAGKMTKDHVIPLSAGGSNFAFNLQPLCRSCNSRKRDRLEAGAQHSLFDRQETVERTTKTGAWGKQLWVPS